MVLITRIYKYNLQKFIINKKVKFMIKKVTEYSIVNSYDSDILVFVDAKLLLESFKDK